MKKDFPTATTDPGQPSAKRIISGEATSEPTVVEKGLEPHAGPEFNDMNDVEPQEKSAHIESHPKPYPPARKRGGPRTATGKAISSRNALKHRIFSSVVLEGRESRAKYLSLLTEFERYFEPHDIIERYLVEKLACIAWRQLRVRIAESAEIEEGAASAFDKTLQEQSDDRQHLPHLGIYQKGSSQSVFKPSPPKDAAGRETPDYRQPLPRLGKYRDRWSQFATKPTPSKDAASWDRPRIGLLQQGPNSSTIARAIKFLNALSFLIQERGLEHKSDIETLVRVYGPQETDPAMMTLRDDLVKCYVELWHLSHLENENENSSKSTERVERVLAEWVKKQMLELISIEVEYLTNLKEVEEKSEARALERSQLKSLLPPEEKLALLIRYDSYLDQAFARTLNELESRRRSRLGQSVPSTVKIELPISGPPSQAGGRRRRCHRK